MCSTFIHKNLQILKAEENSNMLFLKYTYFLFHYVAYLNAVEVVAISKITSLIHSFIIIPRTSSKQRL